MGRNNKSRKEEIQKVKQEFQDTIRAIEQNYDIQDEKREFQDEIPLPLRKKIIIFNRVVFSSAFISIIILFIVLLIYFWTQIIEFLSLAYIDLLNLLLFSGLLISASIFGLNLIIYFSNTYSFFRENEDSQRALIQATKNILYSFPVLMIFIILNYLIWWDDVYLYLALNSDISLDEYIFYSIVGWILYLLLMGFLSENLIRSNKEAIELFKAKQKEEDSK